MTPFPGLIAPEENIGSAFRFENSKNSIIESCNVKNSYLFSLGENSSIILVNHNQEINTIDVGSIKYKIDLAFIITYPTDSFSFRIEEAFDDLISYYISSKR